jgi:hypothetical protein
VEVVVRSAQSPQTIIDQNDMKYFNISILAAAVLAVGLLVSHAADGPMRYVGEFHGNASGLSNVPGSAITGTIPDLHVANFTSDHVIAGAIDGGVTTAGTNVITATNAFLGPIVSSGTNTFSGPNTLSGNNLLTGSNHLTGPITFAGTNSFSAPNTFTGANTSSGSNTYSTSDRFSGLIAPSNSWTAAIPILNEGDCLLRSSNGVPYIIQLLGGTTNILNIVTP